MATQLATQESAATWLAWAQRGSQNASSATPGPISQLPISHLEAQVLLGFCTGLTRTQLIARPEHLIKPAEAMRFQQLVARRAAGEPTAYLIGEQEFWSLPIKVTPAVLIPRPESELLVELALQRLRKIGKSHPGTSSWIADLGTGSGAIAVAIATESASSKVIALDISRSALEVATDNIKNLVGGRVNLLRGDLGIPFCHQRLDLIVSNPPYVEAHSPALYGDGVRFEPRLALEAGTDGLDVIRRLLPAAHAMLRPAGMLMFEHGAEQAQAIAQLISRSALDYLGVERDLAGRPRVSLARRADSTSLERSL